jgi:uncharacterized DUF497 family protein
MLDERFEWDDAKAAANFRKHGVRFEEAAEALLDLNALWLPDAEHSVEEDRDLAIGLTSRMRLLLVIYVERSGRWRIISARRAGSVESALYFDPR